MTIISLPLFRATLKFNAVRWLVFAAILTMYFSIVIGMFDPGMKDLLDIKLAAMPKNLLEAMNFKIKDSSLLGFVVGYLYGFLMVFLPLIYSIITADRMIARQVDAGSMAFLLATPVSRAAVARTQALFLLASITVLFGFITVWGIVISAFMFPGALDTANFIKLNIGLTLLYYALSGVGFFCSCASNESRYSLGVGGGLVVAFLLFKMLSGVGESVSWLKYFSLFTFFDPEAIVAGSEGVALSWTALAALAAALYAGGIALFSRKDLPL
jgi:ABC-2 type transport system permease protein